jgi:hypothetical protein
VSRRRIPVRRHSILPLTMMTVGALGLFTSCFVGGSSDAPARTTTAEDIRNSDWYDEPLPTYERTPVLPETIAFDLVAVHVVEDTSLSERFPSYDVTATLVNKDPVRTVLRTELRLVNETVPYSSCGDHFVSPCIDSRPHWVDVGPVPPGHAVEVPFHYWIAEGGATFLGTGLSDYALKEDRIIWLDEG